MEDLFLKQESEEGQGEGDPHVEGHESAGNKEGLSHQERMERADMRIAEILGERMTREQGPHETFFMNGRELKISCSCGEQIARLQAVDRVLTEIAIDVRDDQTASISVIKLRELAQEGTRFYEVAAEAEHGVPRSMQVLEQFIPKVESHSHDDSRRHD